MKKTILAIALALPVLANTTLAHAEYIMHIAMETPQGGSLPQGSISFGNAAVVTPPVTEPSITEPVEPSIPVLPVLPDLYGKVDPTCNPFVEGDSMQTNLDNRETEWANYYHNNYTDGKSYIPCKLKPVNTPKLVARFTYTFASIGNHCTESEIAQNYASNYKQCYIDARLFGFDYTVNKSAEGVFSLINKPVELYLVPQITSNTGVEFADLERIEIDGLACKNIRFAVGAFGRPTTTKVCDFPISHSDLMTRADKEILVEIYRK